MNLPLPQSRFGKKYQDNYEKIFRSKEMEPELKFFQYTHLPLDLQNVSMQFYNLAQQMIWQLPDSEERKLCLRKLLEAKDCAVRAQL